MREILWKLIDFSIFAIAIAGLIVLRPNMVFYERGYFCHDESIMYPDKGDTIPEIYVYIFAPLIPFLIMILIESVCKPKTEKLLLTTAMPILSRLLYKSQEIYKLFRVFLFGYLATFATVAFVKMMAGRLRPDFLELCKPNFDCSLFQDKKFYVENYTCTDLGPYHGHHPRGSFPSGHAAYSTYGALYTVLYLQERLFFTFSVLLKPIIQLVCILVAIYTSLSRISDNQHHWEDIVAGQLLGITACVTMVCTETNFFKPDSPINQQHEVEESPTKDR